MSAELLSSPVRSELIIELSRVMPELSKETAEKFSFCKHIDDHVLSRVLQALKEKKNGYEPQNSELLIAVMNKLLYHADEIDKGNP